MKDAPTKKELTLNEKLMVLKDMHARSHQDAKLSIEKWQEEVARLEFDKAWLGHPNTIELRDTITNQISSIMVVLGNDANLSEIDRKALFKTKEALFTLLAAFASDPVESLKEIERQVNDEI